MVQYERFDLTIDFANYSQAWFAIADGHLDPYSTLFHLPFWKNDLELLMWPLALLYWVYPHAVTLLWLQAFAIVASELVVLAWVKDSLTRSVVHRRSAPVLGLVTLLLLVTPWSWFTLGFDFHLEPFAALFALLGARDLWAGRYNRMLLWVPLTLVCCAAAGSLYVIAIGTAALMTKRGPRSIPALVVLAGIVWLLFAGAIGGMGLGGHNALATGYGYLSDQAGSNISSANILSGFFVHPLRALEMFRSHGGYVIGYVASGGFIGLLSKWGLVPALVVLLPSALNASALFIVFTSAFQSWAAVLFLIAGSAFALQRFSERNVSMISMTAVGTLTLALSVMFAYLYLPAIHLFADRISPTALAKVRALDEQVPKGAEMIVSQGIIGRFAAGRAAYYYFPRGAPERYSVNRTAGPIWFVLGPVGDEAEGQPAETRKTICYLTLGLHATLITEAAGVWAFRWTPPSGVTSVLLP